MMFVKKVLYLMSLSKQPVVMVAYFVILVISFMILMKMEKPVQMNKVWEAWSFQTNFMFGPVL